VRASRRTRGASPVVTRGLTLDEYFHILLELEVLPHSEEELRELLGRR